MWLKFLKKMINSKFRIMIILGEIKEWYREEITDEYNNTVSVLILKVCGSSWWSFYYAGLYFTHIKYENICYILNININQSPF